MQYWISSGGPLSGSQAICKNAFAISVRASGCSSTWERTASNAGSTGSSISSVSIRSASAANSKNFCSTEDSCSLTQKSFLCTYLLRRNQFSERRLRQHVVRLFRLVDSDQKNYQYT